MQQNLLGKCNFPVCSPGREQEVSEGPARGCMGGWDGHTGQEMQRTNFGSAFNMIKIILALGIALIQLLMKSEGGFGGSWCVSI